MPVALLLQKMLDTLKAAAGALSPWTEIVTLEATIVERARSAFLVHWFGHRLPFDGLALRAHIVNVAELDAQFLAAQRSVLTSQAGPNLTEPLLGFTGMLAGMLISPAGMITAVSLVLRFVAFSLGVFGTALLWVASLLAVGLPFLLAYGLIAAPAGTTILVGGGLAALGFGFALASALGDRREVRGVFDVFGSLAGLMNATVILLRQLTGPRAEVRNPLLGRILDLADRFAGLMAQVLGAAALLVTRIAPVLQPVARTLVGLGALAGSAMSALGVVVDGTVSRVDDLRTGPLLVTRPVDRVVAVARQQVRKVTTLVNGQVDVLVAALTEVQTTLTAKLDVFGGEVGTFVGRLFGEHPTVKVFKALGTQLDAIAAAFAATPKPKPTGPPKPSKIAPLTATLPALPAIRSFPPLPDLPDAGLMRASLGNAGVPPLTMPSIDFVANDIGRADFEAPIELSEKARAAVARTGRRRSVFAPERQALAGGDLTEALRLNVAQLEKFRKAFEVIVGRVLPPELRGTAIPKLVDPAELPVLDLPAEDELAPVVRKLRLRMPGVHVNDVKRFQDMVTTRLEQRSYRVAGGR